MLLHMKRNTPNRSFGLKRLPTLAVGLCIAAVGVSAALAEDSTPPQLSAESPLGVQTESDYVTDPSRWGQLIYDPSETESQGGSEQDTQAVNALIERYYRAWLSRDSEAMTELLDPDASRFRQGQLRSGTGDVIQRITNESRGERPEGQAGSTQLTLRDVKISIDGDTATAFYRIDTHTGARWEYADLATVFQAFRKEDGRWRILHHVESTDLDDPEAPDLPQDVPNRRAPFSLDFVYPAKDLQRATAFYSRFLGDPEHADAQRTVFRLRDSRFHLEAKPFDERITIKEGAGNGYGIIHVADLEESRRALQRAGAPRIDPPRPCGPDICLIAEDPSGNILVWEQRRPSVSSTPVRPTVSLEENSQSEAAHEVKKIIDSWARADRSAVIGQLDENALWVDDSLAGNGMGVAAGVREIAPALDARWSMIDRGPDGLEADLEIQEVREVPFGDRSIVMFDLISRFRGPHISTERAFVTQIWSGQEGEKQLETSFIAVKRQDFDRPVNSMDYTAYPLNDLGRDGRFYKTVLGSEPYRDENWFGFWSTSSVFGMFEKDSETTPFRPYPHRNNGYADLSIRSAEETLRLLQETDAPLPHVPGINNQPGIDPNPGYTQILAIDPEGNLINFSEYLEY